MTDTRSLRKMKIKGYISLISLLLMLTGALVRAQYVAEVCAGDTGVAFMVEGWETSTFNWTVEGGTITRHYGDSIIVDWPMIPGEYEVTVKEVSLHGCAGNVQKAMVLVSGPDLNLGDDRAICTGETFTISPDGAFSSYLWQDGSTGSSFATDQEGWITLEVSDGIGCRVRDSMYLEVSPVPYVDLGPDTSLCGDESLVLDAGTDGTFYTWSTGDNSRTITVYKGYQEIWAEVENEYGCSSRDEILIDDCGIDDFFEGIPTAITPNNDGANDVWNIYKLLDYPDAVVEIYDRWGTLVWRSEPGYPESWNGTNRNGKIVPMDSYHFVIMFNNRRDDRVSGSITVIR